MPICIEQVVNLQQKNRLCYKTVFDIATVKINLALGITPQHAYVGIKSHREYLGYR